MSASRRDTQVSRLKKFLPGVLQTKGIMCFIHAYDEGGMNRAWENVDTEDKQAFMAFCESIMDEELEYLAAFLGHGDESLSSLFSDFLEKMEVLFQIESDKEYTEQQNAHNEWVKTTRTSNQGKVITRGDRVLSESGMTGVVVGVVSETAQHFGSIKVWNEDTKGCCDQCGENPTRTFSFSNWESELIILDK